MTIKVKYINNSNKEFNTFEEIENIDLVLEINCANNNLSFLPNNISFPNLQKFDCHNNILNYLIT